MLALGVSPQLFSQSKGFIVKRCTFSSSLNDEFSPVFYKNGIVFCSNLRDNSLASYKNGGERLFNIVYVSGKGTSGWKQPVIFSKELTTRFNEGPATFNNDGSLIYFARNNLVTGSLKNISDSTNKQGIYHAELKEGKWVNIKLLTFDDPTYNYCTPSLSPDASRIYFSSDMPGGYGGMDLYYSNFVNGDWDKPVNLGPVINTLMNESFPFAASFGVLYFASDGHNGLGGKDIYYTRELNGKWIEPVHLDSAINSPFDDFGLVTDSTFEHGFFSSNRMKTDDIFTFRSAPVEFPACDTIRENKYCFIFYDERHSLIDTIPAMYVWDFGEGIIRKGSEVKHCFPGPGKYSVRLSIFDEVTGDTIAEQVNYNVDLEQFKQATIKSYDVGLSDNSISFTGEIGSLKGEGITDFFWDFGDGFIPGSPVAEHTFKKEGEYPVKLGLYGKGDTLGNVRQSCIMKKIRIFGSRQELNMAGEVADNGGFEKTEGKSPDKTFKIIPFLMDDLSQREKSVIRTRIESLKSLFISFSHSGISLASDPLLENMVKLLNENPGIRLEAVVHSVEKELPDAGMETYDMLAQELAFYFRNKEIGSGRFISYGLNSANSLSKTELTGSATADRFIEFIFMKNR